MRRAFTLLETLLSVALLGIILVFLLNLFPSSIATVKSSEQRMRAGTLAQSTLSQQMGLPFGQLPVGLSQDLPPQTIDQIEYRIHVDVLAADTADPQILRALRVTVTWTVREQQRQVVRELWIHRLPSQVS